MDAFNVVPKRYFVEFTIYDLPPSINQIGRKHWAVQAKNSRKWHELVKLSLKTYVPRLPLRKARLTLKRFSSHPIDPDNLVISFKPVVDGLVKHGVLVNDKFANIGMPVYKWVKTEKNKGFIVVTVEEVKPEEEGLLGPFQSSLSI